VFFFSSPVVAGGIHAPHCSDVLPDGRAYVHGALLLVLYFGWCEEWYIAFDGADRYLSPIKPTRLLQPCRLKRGCWANAPISKYRPYSGGSGRRTRNPSWLEQLPRRNHRPSPCCAVLDTSKVPGHSECSETIARVRRVTRGMPFGFARPGDWIPVSGSERITDDQGGDGQR